MIIGPFSVKYCVNNLIKCKLHFVFHNDVQHVPHPIYNAYQTVFKCYEIGKCG